MNKEYSCELIRDLLPGYMDAILSKTSTDIVANHLTTCSECRLLYQEMAAELEDTNRISRKEYAAVDGLKKIRKQTLHLKTAVAFVSGILGILLLCLFFSTYVIGAVQPPSLVTITDLHYDEETQALTINGTLDHTFAKTKVSRIVCKENASFANRIDVSVYAAKPLPFQKEKRNFSVTIPNVKGRTVSLVGANYEQSEVYSWRKNHFEQLNAMEEEIYSRFPSEWKRDNTRLSCSDGIETVDGMDGVLFYVDFLVGDEDASYQEIGDTVLSYGDLEPANFMVWVSLDAPHKILIRNQSTGEYTADFTVLEQLQPRRRKFL